jgi:hypothetical protein
MDDLSPAHQLGYQKDCSKVSSSGASVVVLFFYQRQVTNSRGGCCFVAAVVTAGIGSQVMAWLGYHS